MSDREVLIVEDDPKYRGVIKRALKDEDFTFFEAGSVREGVSRLNKNPKIKVILLDLNLPDGSGRDILEHIKGRASKYRVIVLTAHEEYLAAGIAREFSVFNYLPKAGGSFVQSIRFSVEQAFNDIEDKHYAIKIFISYTNPDFDKVAWIYKRLKDNGFCPWIDKIDIRPGYAWNKEIEKAISDCDFFLSCLSDISVKRLSYFQTETKLAVEKHDRMKGDPFILPLIFDNCDMPPEFVERNIQHINYHTFYDDWWAMLLETLRAKRRPSDTRRRKEKSTLAVVQGVKPKD